MFRLLLVYTFADPLAVEVEGDEAEADDNVLCISLLPLTIDAFDDCAVAVVVCTFLEDDIADDCFEGVALPLKGFIYEGIMLKIFSCSRLTTSFEGWRADEPEDFKLEASSALVEEDEEVVVGAREAVDLRTIDC